jgi:hypothetical protein
MIYNKTSAKTGKAVAQELGWRASEKKDDWGEFALLILWGE